MKIRVVGRYESDDNFTCVFAENGIYVIPHNAPDDWGYIEVGQRAAMGKVLDQATYDGWKSKCAQTGTFTLERGLV